MSIKFPRMYHLPLSPKKISDDKVADVDYFTHLRGKELIFTSKLDGGNACITYEGLVFARTHGKIATDPSFDYIKSKVPQITPLLYPRGIDVYGENLYRVQSIFYSNLPNWFFIIAIRHRQKGLWLSWDETAKISQILQFPTVPSLNRATFLDEHSFQTNLENAAKIRLYGESHPEGIVVRIADQFTDDQFHQSIFKWVNATFEIRDLHKTKEVPEINQLSPRYRETI